jgi:hypothetical protein
MASLGGTGNSKTSGTSGGGSASHDMPLVKTVFSAGLQQSKPYVDVFSSQVR